MAFKITDPVKFFSLGLNIAFVVLVIMLLKHCGCPPCYEAGETVVTIDTIRPTDTIPKMISLGVPTPVKSIPKKVFKKATVKKSFTVDSVWQIDTDGKAFAYVKDFHGVGLAEDDCLGPAVASVPSPCDTINIYSDTIYKRDTCTFIVNDTVEGRILGRSILYANLQPLIRETITHVKKDKWKVYVGGAFTYNGKFLDRWGAGPKAAVAIPKIGAIDYYFDAKNMSHTVGVMALIRFKK
jgi:hypothetical protein